ncbi:MAG: AraC-like DNA-binding protein [Flavobacteriales bacterium]|jgi:AraC-like DNA-binding protein
MGSVYIESIRTISPLILGAGIFTLIFVLSKLRRENWFSELLLLVFTLIFVFNLWNAYVRDILQNQSLVLMWPFSNMYWLTGPVLYSFIKSRLYPDIKPIRYWPHLLPFLLASTFVRFNAAFSYAEWVSFVAIWGMMMSFYIVIGVMLLVKIKRIRNTLYASEILSAHKWAVGLLVGFTVFTLFDLTLGIRSILGLPRTALFDMTFILIKTLYVLFLIVFLQSLKAKKVIDSMDFPGEPPELEQSNKDSRLSSASAAEVESLLEQELTTKEIYCRSDINLRTLANSIGVSPHNLSDALNGHMGTSFYSYINKHRAKRAEQMLTSTKDLITDIAVDCGFNSRSSFYKVFKNSYGMTPSEYRKCASQRTGTNVS